MGDLANRMRIEAVSPDSPSLRRLADEVEAMEARVAKADRWLAERIEATDRAGFVEEENTRLRAQLEARKLTAEEARAVLAGTEHVTHSKQRDKYRMLLRSARAKLALVAGRGDE